MYPTHLNHSRISLAISSLFRFFLFLTLLFFRTATVYLFNFKLRKLSLYLAPLTSFGSFLSSLNLSIHLFCVDSFSLYLSVHLFIYLPCISLAPLLIPLTPLLIPLAPFTIPLHALALSINQHGWIHLISTSKHSSNSTLILLITLS